MNKQDEQKLLDAVKLIDTYIIEVNKIRRYLNGTKRKIQEVTKTTAEDKWPKRENKNENS